MESDNQIETANKMSLAKARYDNIAESPDELAFRKGDVLTVLEQKIDGLNGWWLCSFRGRQGIVPANRLTLLAGKYNSSCLRFSTSPDSSVSSSGIDYDVPKSHPANRELPPLPDDTPDGIYDKPKSSPEKRAQPAEQHSRPAWDDVNNTVMLYDYPSSQHRNNSRTTLSPTTTFKSVDSGAIDVFSNSNRSSMLSNTSAPSSNSSGELITPNGSSLIFHHNRALNNNHQLDSSESCYDVPKPSHHVPDSRDSGIYDNANLQTIRENHKYQAVNTLKSAGKPFTVTTQHKLLSQSTDMVYDVPTSLTSTLVEGNTDNSSQNIVQNDLDIHSATKILVKLQQHVHTSIARLNSSTSYNRRSKDLSSVTWNDFKDSCKSLQQHLADFLSFCRKCLVTSRSLKDQSIRSRLEALVEPLTIKLSKINSITKDLSGKHSNMVEVLTQAENQLNALLATNQSLSDDVTSIASFIHANSIQLFTLQSNGGDNSSQLSKSDGVSVENRNSSKLLQTSDHLEYDYCELKTFTEANMVTLQPPVGFSDSTRELPAEDIKYLHYYMSHIDKITEVIRRQTRNIASMLASQFIEKTTLVSHVKMLLVTAHTLVYSADSLTRVLTDSVLLKSITESTNELCNSLKLFVMNTKEVALMSAHTDSYKSCLKKLENTTTSILTKAIVFQNALAVNL